MTADSPETEEKQVPQVHLGLQGIKDQVQRESQESPAPEVHLETKVTRGSSERKAFPESLDLLGRQDKKETLDFLVPQDLQVRSDLLVSMGLTDLQDPKETAGIQS